MEDFCYAGGLPVVMKEISQHLHLDLVTANGQTVAANIADAENFNADVIKPLSAPFKEKAGIAVLRGNLSPRGAVIKPAPPRPRSWFTPVAPWCLKPLKTFTPALMTRPWTLTRTA
jgi:dihydroxy-acid dehydratase